MGKGDIKSKRGKIINGSFGVKRRKKKGGKPVLVAKKAVDVKEPAKEVVTIKEPAAKKETTKAPVKKKVKAESKEKE